MAKTKRLIGLVVAIIICLSAFAGCSLFTQSTNDYRSQVAVRVAGEEITLGQFSDVFTNLYYDYYSYIYYGYYTMSDIAQMAYDTLVNSSIIMSDYKALAQSENLIYSHDYLQFKDAKYLTADDMQYIMKSAKKALFGSYDSALETLVKSAGYELGEAETETESGRTPQVYKTISSIIDIKLDSLDKEGVDKYLQTTQGGTSSEYWMTEGGYIFTDPADPALIKRVAELNARIDLEEEQAAVTPEQYIKYQKEAVSNVRQNIYSNYGLEPEGFLKGQIEAYINSRIVNSAAAIIFKIQVESDIPTLLQKLSAHYEAKKKAAEEQYTINSSAFVKFIEGLTNTSVIYTIPQEYQGKYVFVKNLLIPFTQEQLDHLTAKEEEFKENEEEEEDWQQEYLAYRENYARYIVMKNYLSGQNTENVFVFDEVTGKITLAPDTVLSDALNDVSSTADFVELMYKYNSDTAQFSSQYSYVVRIDAPEDYTAKWVNEFVEAAEEAYSQGVGGTGLAVSEFGVHIVYYEGVVTQEAPDFTAQKIFDTSTFEYRYYSAYYDSVSAAYVNDKVTALKKTITVQTTKAFNNFMKTNNLTVNANKN